ncbi:MAG: TonB-dependent receptor [Gammaproteobacteria bacterium]|nr:TonB-dependent receptor [Gammaproteobacteria bacterium]
MNNFAKKSPLVIALSMALMPQLSAAQMLEEVIVTAQKRAESLQDVPISVTALQGEKIQEAGIGNMAAMADYVPNLHIANAAVNTNIYMRGVGSGNNQGFEQSVGMYIDGIYMGRGRQYRNAFLDLERVEVLRGPQGTLFGRNTIAGAINITSASPNLDDPLNAEISVSAETNGGLLVEGFLGGSVTEDFAARFAFKYRESDGHIENVLTGGDEPEIEETAYRVTLVWQPTDNLDMKLKYSNSNEERAGAQSSTWFYLDSPEARDAVVPNRGPLADPAYFLNDSNFPGFAAQAGTDFETFKDNGFGSGSTVGVGRYPDGDDAEVDNFALNIDYQVGDYTLTSVTGWSEYEVQSGADVDWLPLRYISRDDDQTYEQFSQEIRITSPGGEFFDFVAGAYYDTSELVSDRLVALDFSFDDTFGDVLGSDISPALPPIPLRAIGVTSGNALFTTPPFQYFSEQIARNHLYELDSESWAVFFQGTFNLTDVFRVTVGLRYTKEEKDVKSRQFLADEVLGYDTPNNNFYLGQIQSTLVNTYAYNYEDDRSTDDLTPSVTLQWDVGEDSMLYASFSQGFKSGGFTAADDGEPAGLELGEWPCSIEPDGSVDINACYDPTQPNDDFEFDDETVDAYEIGGKHTLFDSSFSVNWAIFYTEYDDLQTAIFKGIGFTTTNAGASEITGLEVDTRWAVTDNLQLGLNFAWLDAEYADFADAPCTAIQLDANPRCGIAGNELNTFNDLSGETTLYASDYSASFIWDYSYPLGAMDLFVSGEVNYRDEFNSAGDNDPIDVIEDYTKVNLRFGLRADQWEIMAYGRNITDEAALSQSFDTPTLTGSHSRFMEEGEVYGVRAKYMF